MEDNYIRGRRAKLLLYEDSMSDVDEKMLEEIFDKFNETGCTSFRITPEQLRQLIEKDEEGDKL